APGTSGRASAGCPLFQASRISRSRSISRGRIAMVGLRRTMLALFLALTALPLQAQDRFITVASTTSTEQSGLFAFLLPIYEQQTGVKVRVVALGTGQALDVGRRGDADVVFVHARAAEEKFLAEGQGVKRYPVMYNDFVLIGP